jgi:hypothetical protein
METFSRPFSYSNMRHLKNKTHPTGRYTVRGPRIFLWLNKIRIRRQFGEAFIFERAALEEQTQTPVFFLL